MQIACVFVAHLEAKAELRRRPELRERSGLIVTRTGRRARIADYLPATPGVIAGMTMEQALAEAPDSIILEADVPYYRTVSEEIVNTLQGVSDRVEDAGPGLAYLDAAGMDSVYGPEDGFSRTLCAALPPDLQPRVGLARGKFPAYMAARTARPGHAVNAPANAAAFLADQSISLLPLTPAAHARMRQLGLHVMGDVTSLSRRRLHDQFGPEGARAWELSQGWDESPLQPRPHVPHIAESMALPFHTAAVAALRTTLEVLLQRAFARPWMRGRGAGQATLRCALSGLPPWTRKFHVNPAAWRWEQAAAALGLQLETDLPEGVVEEVTLTLSDFTLSGGWQPGLLERPPDARRQPLAQVEQHLTRRFGSQALYRVVEVAPWHPVPERRALRVSLDTAAPDAVQPLQAPTPIPVREGEHGQPVAMRLRQDWQEVAAISDRWTFDLWWLPQPLTRTYYDVVDRDGRPATLFRDQQADRWYRQSA